MADVTIDDVLSFLKGSVRHYDSNVPNSPPKEKGAFNTTTKGEIEAASPKGGDVVQFLKDYLSNIGKTAMLPVRGAQVAGSAVADVVKNIGASLMDGGKRPDPLAHTSGAVDDFMASANPLMRGASSIPSRRELGEKMGLLYDEPVGAFAGNPAAKSAVEGVPASGPVPAMPAMPAGRRVAAPGNAPAVAPAVTQGGAFAAPSGPQMPPAVAPSAQAAGPATQEGAFAAPQPAAESLAEQFRKRSAEIPRDGDGKLTQEQKAQAELNFFLGLMAKSARPGARMLGAFGESGQESLKGVAEQQDKNLSRSEKNTQQKRDDLYKEMGFEKMDRDDKRADRRATTEEKRWAAADNRDQARLDIERQKLAAEGKEIRQTVVNDKGQYVHFLKGGGQIVSDVKAKPEKGHAPSATSEAINLLMTRGGMSFDDALNRVMPEKPKGNFVIADDEVGKDEFGKPQIIRRPIDLTTGEFLRPKAPKGYANEAEAHAAARKALKGEPGKPGKDPAAVNKLLQELGYKPL